MTTITAAGRRADAFIATKEHRRFVEFADAVRRELLAKNRASND